VNTKTSLIAFLALTTVGGVILAWHEYQQTVHLADELLKAGGGSALQARIAALEKENRELQDELAASRLAAIDEGTDQPAADDGNAETNGGSNRRQFGRGRPGFAAMQQLLAKPEVQALINSTEKAAVDARYAALFRALNLSPEQADKLKQLLIDRENVRQDVFAAARDQGIDPRTDREAFQKLLTDARNSVNENIKSLLGDQGYSQFTNYEQTMPQRNIVNALQQRLSATDVPLSASQSDQLVQILAANAPAGTNGNAANGGGWRGGDFGGGPGRFGAGMGGGTGMGALTSAPITPTAISQASAVLNQNQLSALEQLQQQQQTAQQLQQMMRSAWQQNGAAGGGTAQPTGGRGGAGRRRGGG
jgi:hypothetical protein